MAHSRIVYRAFQGIGGAGLYSLTTIVLPEIGPAEKPQIISIIMALTLSMSFVLGPILGGIISEHTTWRVIYWLKYVCKSFYDVSSSTTS